MRDVADVEQAVDAAEIEKRTVRHEGTDGGGDGVAFLHGRLAGGAFGAGLLFEDNAAVDDDVFVGDFELGDAAVDLGADELFDLGCVAGAAAAGGHEGADADVYRETALDDFSDGADDGELFGKRSFKCGPVAGLRDFEAGELVVVLLVTAGDGDRDRVAGLDGFGIVLKSGAGQNALGLVADVEEDLVGGDGYDGSLQLPCAGLRFVRVAALEVAEKIGEGLCGFFFDELGSRLDGGLGRRGGNRLGDDCSGWFGDRLWNWLGRDFRGGQRFGNVFFGHGRLVSILP